MSFNLAPELLIDPKFDGDIFASGSVLEGHRVNMDCGVLQETLVMQNVPSARLVRVDVRVAADDMLDDFLHPTPLEAGYWVTTGISPNRKDHVSIPALENENDPATALEDALNIRILKSISQIQYFADQIKSKQVDMSAWERQQQIVTGLLGGYAAAIITMATSGISISSFDRFTTSASVGIVVASKTRKAFAKDRQNEESRSKGRNISPEQKRYDYIPKILQIVSIK